MIQVTGLGKSFARRVLFSDVNFTINAGERIGVLGRNGHGKSTLFKILMGDEVADQGQVITPKRYKLGCLEQHLHFTAPTLREEAALGLPVEERENVYQAEKILFGLGFSREDLDKSPQQFSGGYQIRINLTKLLLSQSNMLLLDEPTNYLDIKAIHWVKDFLKSWPGEIMLITHDRSFMDDVVTHCLLVHRQKVRKMAGGTSEIYSKVMQDEEIYEKTRLNDDRKRKQVELFIDRFRSKASKASLVQSRIKQLDKTEKMSQLLQQQDLEFSFAQSEFNAKVLGQMENVGFSYHPESPFLFKELNLVLSKGDRVAVIGPNGRGKSTLLRLIAGELTPTVGQVKFHPAVRTGYFGQTHIDRLQPNLTIEEEIQSMNPLKSKQEVRGIAGAMMFEGDEALKKVSVLSGGERSRVMLGKILMSPTNLLLLDEPTNHLDMESIESLMEAIEVFDGAVVLVSHSEGLLSNFAQKLVVFDGDRCFTFLGGYDEFLSKIGWQQEADSAKTNSAAKNTNTSSAPKGAPPTSLANKGTSTVPRESLKSVQSKLKKVSNELQKLEQQIISSEEFTLILQRNIQSSSENSEWQKVKDLTQQLDSHEKQIGKDYTALEALMDEQEKLNRMESELKN